MSNGKCLRTDAFNRDPLTVIPLLYEGPASLGQIRVCIPLPKTKDA
jgi:hypothetical protein